MLFLHTSDWHLGSEMEGRRRIDESAALLRHIIKTIQRENVNTLIVSGDVFDSHAPSNQATRQYNCINANALRMSSSSRGTMIRRRIWKRQQAFWNC